MQESTERFLEYRRRPERPALARLLEVHQEAVYSVCYRVLRHPQDAEDACQEVLIEVARQVDSIHEPAAFSTWLYRTALHTALDLRRKRGRQRSRDAASRETVQAETPESAEALHAGLAGLDEPSRLLVVEHYFARRPLRELAAERGCSEVAVWKRIEHARERLRKLLGSAAIAALEGTVDVRIPAGLAAKALRVAGGLAMAGKVGVKVAIVLPLLLLAGAGAAKLTRRPEPAAPRPVFVPGPSTPAAFATSSPLPEPRVGAPAPAVPAAPRLPYPFRLPAPGGTNAEQLTWSVLSRKRLTIHETNSTLGRILQIVARESGLTFLVEPELGDSERMSLVLTDLCCSASLKLMLQPRNLGYEIRPDGAVRVARQDELQGGYEREADRIQGLLSGLEMARASLDAGGRSVDELSDVESNAAALRAEKLLIPQGETTLEEEVRRLSELGFGILIDLSPGTPSEASRRSRRFVREVGEVTFGDHIDRLARENGLVALVLRGSLVCLADEEQAALRRVGEEEFRASAAQVNRPLDLALDLAGSRTYQELFGALGRVPGLTAVPSSEAWEKDAAIDLPAGATVRQALDLLKAQGFRWAFRAGSVYVFR